MRPDPEPILNFWLSDTDRSRVTGIRAGINMVHMGKSEYWKTGIRVSEMEKPDPGLEKIVG